MTRPNPGADNRPDNGGGAAPPEGDDPDTTPDTDPAGGDEADGDGDDGHGGGEPQNLGDVMATLDTPAQRIVRAAVNKKNTENRNLRQKLSAAETKARKYDEAQEADRGADEVAAEREREANERAQRATERMVRSEIRALAAARFADPEDAPAFLGEVSEFLAEDGEPDSDSIGSALDDLLERKPHLAKPTSDPSKPRPPAPNRAQGTSGSGSKPTKTTGTELGRDMFRDRHKGRQPAAS